MPFSPQPLPAAWDAVSSMPPCRPSGRVGTLWPLEGGWWASRTRPTLHENETRDSSAFSCCHTVAGTGAGSGRSGRASGRSVAPPPERMRPATEFMEVRGWEGESVGARFRITPLPPVEATGPVAEVARLRGLTHSTRTLASSATPAIQPPVSSPYVWQVLPDGLIYKSYLAGLKEARMGTQAFYERDEGWKWDITLGGRVGILRYGTPDVVNPEGWQIRRRRGGVSAARSGAGNGPRRGRLSRRPANHVGLRPVAGEAGVLSPQLALRRRVSAADRDDDAIQLQPRCGRARSGVLPDRGRATVRGGGLGRDSHRRRRAVGVSIRRRVQPGGTDRFRGRLFSPSAAHLRQEIDFSGNLVVQTGWQWRGLGGELLRRGSTTTTA